MSASALNGVDSSLNYLETHRKPVKRHFADSSMAQYPMNEPKRHNNGSTSKGWLESMVSRLSSLLVQRSPESPAHSEQQQPVIVKKVFQPLAMGTPRKQSRRFEERHSLADTTGASHRPSIIPTENDSIIDTTIPLEPERPKTLADAMLNSLTGNLSPLAPRPRHQTQARANQRQSRQSRGPNSSFSSILDSSFRRSVSIASSPKPKLQSRPRQRPSVSEAKTDSSVIFDRMRAIPTESRNVSVGQRTRIVDKDAYFADMHRRKQELLKEHLEWKKSRGLYVEPEKPAEPEKPRKASKEVEPLKPEETQAVRKAQSQADSTIFGTINRVEITAHDLKTLKYGQWLNDNVIDAFLSVVTSAAQTKSFAFTTHFFTRLQESGYKAVSRWAKKKNVNVWELDYLFVPINVGGSHWTVVAVDHRDKTMTFYDSMRSSSKRSSEALDTVASYMTSEAQRLAIDRKIDQYERIPGGDCPQQANGYDCGVFMCETVRRLADDEALDHDQSNMKLIRDRMAWSLYKLATGGVSRL